MDPYWKLSTLFGELGDLTGCLLTHLGRSGVLPDSDGTVSSPDRRKPGMPSPQHLSIPDGRCLPNLPQLAQNINRNWFPSFLPLTWARHLAYRWVPCPLASATCKLMLYCQYCGTDYLRLNRTHIGKAGYKVVISTKLQVLGSVSLLSCMLARSLWKKKSTAVSSSVTSNLVLPLSTRLAVTLVEPLAPCAPEGEANETMTAYPGTVHLSEF